MSHRRVVSSCVSLVLLWSAAAGAAEPPPAPAATPSTSAATSVAPAAAEAPTAETPVPAVDVVMYTTQTCGYCAKARQHLAERHVAWREIDIEASDTAKADFERHGGIGTPLIFVADERVAGYDVQRLDGALRRHALIE